MCRTGARGCSNAGHEVESSRTRHLCLSQVFCPSCSSSFVPPAQVSLSLSSSFVFLSSFVPPAQVPLSLLSSFVLPAQFLFSLSSSFVPPAQVPLSLSSSFVSLKFLCPSCSSSHVHSKILVCSPNRVFLSASEQLSPQVLTVISKV